MRNETRKLFEQYTAQIASANGVNDVTKTFTVSPSVAQRLETRIQESSSFLQAINMVMVPEQSGQALGLGVGSTIAGRTNTATTDREPSNVLALDGYDYTCVHTDLDTAITWAQLDAWAKFPDFLTRYRNAVTIRQALDRIMIGWNGTSAAVSTDRSENPLLQDVNIGWIKKVRTNRVTQIMSNDGKEGSSAIAVGSVGAEYVNLDALVFDLVSSMIDPWYREDPNLRVIVGRQLLADHYFPLINKEQVPTEMQAAQIVVSQKRIGGLPAVQVPFFPANALCVTTLDNLSIYTQEGSRRRNIVENPKRSRVEDYQSVNDAYVVEDYGRIAIAENIVLA